MDHVELLPSNFELLGNVQGGEGGGDGRVGGKIKSGNL